METKKCIGCGREKAVEKFQNYGFQRLDGKFSRQRRCHACLGEKRRAYYKLAFLDAYGNKCSCCGESDPRFLTLDHRNGDGCIQRKRYKNHQIYMLAKKQGYPNSYTVLCFNCNSGRSVNGGTCPHKEGTTEQAWIALRQSVRYVRGN